MRFLLPPFLHKKFNTTT